MRRTLFLSACSSRFHDAIRDEVRRNGYPATFEEAAAYLVQRENDDGALNSLLKPYRGPAVASIARTGGKKTYGPCNICKDKGLRFDHTPEGPSCSVKKSHESTSSKPTSSTDGSKSSGKPTSTKTTSAKSAHGKRRATASVAVTSPPDVIMVCTTAINSATASDAHGAQGYADEVAFDMFGVPRDYFYHFSVLHCEDDTGDELNGDEQFASDLPDLVESDDESEPDNDLPDLVQSDDESESDIVLPTEMEEIIITSPAPTNALSYMSISNSEIILDSGANYSVVSDINLLSDKREIPGGRLISGIGGATIKATHIGRLWDFDDSTLCAPVGRNLLSVSRLVDSGYSVAIDPVLNAFKVQLDNKPPYYFTRNAEWLYVLVLSLDESQVLSTLSHSGASRHLSAAEISRANAALDLHAALNHPSDASLGCALDNNVYRGTNLTSKDLRNGRSLHGPCALSVLWVNLPRHLLLHLLHLLLNLSRSFMLISFLSEEPGV